MVRKKSREQVERIVSNVFTEAQTSVNNANNGGRVSVSPLSLQIHEASVAG